MYEAIERFIPGIDRYVLGHVEPGSFLRAVLENDLEQACVRADPMSRLLLYVLVDYLSNIVPRKCWGSAEKVKAWLDARKTSSEKAGN